MQREFTTSALFTPRSIVVIDGSADEGKIGWHPIRYLRLADYTGRFNSINPNRDTSVAIIVIWRVFFRVT